MPSETPNLAAIQPIEAPKLSTTARLLVSFAKVYFQVPDMPYGSTLARSTTVFAGFGQLFEKLNSLSDDASVIGIAKEILGKLKTAGTPVAKATYDSLSRDAEPVLQHSEELTKKAELLRQSYYEDRDKTFKTLESILQMVAAAKNPIEKANSQEILNQLITAEKTRQSLKIELEKLEKARLVTYSQLGAISQKGFDALPSKEKAGVSLPTAPTIRPD